MSIADNLRKLKEQVDSLFFDTILAGLSEDLEYESREQCQEVLDYFKNLAKTIDVDQVYFGDDE